MWDAFFEASDLPMAFYTPTGERVHSNSAFERMAARDGGNLEQAVEQMIKGGSEKDGLTIEKDVELNPGKGLPSQAQERKVCIRIAAKRLLSSPGLDHILVTLEDRSEFAELMTKLTEARATKNRFLATLSHEVRTPMNHIMGITDLLLGTRLNESQKDLLMRLSESADRLMGMLSDMLDYSRLKIGSPTCDDMDYDLRLLLETIGKNTAVKAAQKKIGFELEIHSLVPSLLKGDPGRLRKILNHLCDNAVKFTDQGKIELKVFPDRQIKDRVRLRFEVRDTGPGIPEGDMGKIFDLFTQLDDTSTRRQGGSGLGLAFAGELIHNLNGNMGVENQPQEGACFWFTLDFSKQDSYQDARCVFSFDSVKDKRVLICTPHTGDLNIFTTLITDWGGLCETARTASQAEGVVLSAMETGEPVDIVIMDLQLPNAGEEILACRLRDLNPDQMPLVALLTSRAQPGDAERFFQAGVKVYLPKPVRANELQQALVVALSRENFDGIITRHTLREYRKKMVNILIIGPGTATGKMTLNTLATAGYRAAIFDNLPGPEEFDKDVFNIVLAFLDVNTGGNEIVSQLQAIKERRPALQIHVIAIGEPEPGRGLREAMVDARISSSFSSKDLLSVVAKQAAFIGTSLEKHSRPSQDGHTIFNYQAALNRAMGDKDFLKALSQEFQTALMSKIFMLKEAVADNDMARALTLSQSIKGASGNMGANGVFQLVKKVETLVEEKDWDQISGKVAALENEAILFKTHLTHFNWEQT